MNAKRPGLALLLAALLTACAPATAAPAAPMASATIQRSAAPSTPPPTPIMPSTPTPPASAAPPWMRDLVLYQIFPRSFRDSDGDGIGDLQGVREQLEYVQSLGANAIWLNPHTPATTYHGYDVVDYTAVNPQFGTLDDFKALLDDMHARDMKLIVDFVANHASNAHPFFQDAYKNPASKYTSWFHFSDANNETYRAFAGVAELPEWNHGNPEVMDYLIRSALFWLDLGADGLRLDYALGLSPEAWREFTQALKAQHPDALLLGEVWDSGPLKLKPYYEAGFDALFDFPAYLALTGSHDANGDGLINGQGAPGVLQSMLIAAERIYPSGAGVVRFASNHDTNRVASDVESDPRRMRLAAEFSLLAPGIPIVYYGEEIGMRGSKGPGPIYDEYRREPMDWYAAESGPGMAAWFRPDDRNNRPGDGVSVEEQHADPESLLAFYRSLAQLRAVHPALRSDDYQVMKDVAGCPNCLGVWRWDASEVIALIFNFSDQAHALDFNAAEQAPVPIDGDAEFIHGGPSAGEDLVIEPWSTLAMRWPARANN